MMPHYLEANWPAPKQIKAYTTLRADQFNLADHVNDDHDKVMANRQQLKKILQLPAEPIWLNQTHSTIAVPALPENLNQEADASFTDQAGQVCVVMTADCLPILLCHRQGTHVAAIHAGWRGLANGIIENTLDALSLPPEDMLVWLGPAIGPRCFEVGAEVRDQFIQLDAAAESAFSAGETPDKWFSNLYQLAKIRLKKRGIHAVYGGEYCTYLDKELFFSYRREQGNTGRMATLIWIEE